MPEPVQARIQRALETLVASPHQESSLVLASGAVYLLFISSSNEDCLRMEAVTSEFLPAPLKLSAGRTNELRKLGFDRSGRTRNWSRELELERANLPRLAQESTDILRLIYGIDRVDDVLTMEMRHDDHERPENQPLIEAMRALAHEDNAATRHGMYTALVNAHFLVPTLEEPRKEDSSGPSARDFKLYDVADGFPIFAAFSDWDSFRLWRPRGCRYRVVHGSEFFQALLEREAAALEINPAGNVGGQLFRHEIELLAEAVQHHRRTRMN